MIDRVYKLVQTVSNNELNGNISPQEFRLLVNNSVMELYEEVLHEAKRATSETRRYGRTFSIENISDKLREKIAHYYQPQEITKTGDTYNLPDDLRYIDSVEINGIDVERTENRKQFRNIIKFEDTAPSEDNPLFLHVGSAIEVAPESVNSPLTVYYLRNPKPANWTYQMIGGVEVFNPDAPDFQDIDIHPSEEYQLSIRILQKLGINLKEQQLTQYGLQKEQTDFQKENAN